MIILIWGNVGSNISSLNFPQLICSVILGKNLKHMFWIPHSDPQSCLCEFEFRSLCNVFDPSPKRNIPGRVKSSAFKALTIAYFSRWVALLGPIGPEE